MLCTCPVCSSNGKSVAAMNYAETKLWDKTGRFSGAGIGIGTGGIGVGVGGGTYSESGTQRSKRAAVFAEPARFELPVAPLMMAVVFIIALYMLPAMLSFMTTTLGGVTGESSQVIPTMSYTETITSILPYIIPFLAIIIFLVAYSNYKREAARVDHLNNVVYPKKLARYNELRYCENCHVLFDDKGNKENANEFGFEKLMLT